MALKQISSIKFISDKASITKNANLELETIKFKPNPKELSLFLETENPKLTYKKISAIKILKCISTLCLY